MQDFSACALRFELNVQKSKMADTVHSIVAALNSYSKEFECSTSLRKSFRKTLKIASTSLFTRHDDNYL